MLYKKMQKADAHLSAGIRNKSNHNITFFHCENTLTLMGLILVGIKKMTIRQIKSSPNLT